MTRLSTLFLLFLATAPLAAKAEVLHCMVTPDKSDNGWVLDEYYLVIDREAKTIEVVDGFIQEEHGGPIAAESSTISDEKLVFSWRSYTTDSKGQKATMIYRGTYFPKLDQFRVSSKPMGYRNSYEAYGTCTQD